VLQPVIQFGTAIHGKNLSGGVLNRCQKLLHVTHFVSVTGLKRANVSKGILANRTMQALVAAVTRGTPRQAREQGVPGYLS
jgi:hypothetical protein